MPKYPKAHEHLFVYEDVTEKLVCPNCKEVVKVVIPATSVVYLVHHNGEMCVLAGDREYRSGQS